MFRTAFVFLILLLVPTLCFAKYELEEPEIAKLLSYECECFGESDKNGFETVSEPFYSSEDLTDVTPGSCSVAGFSGFLICTEITFER